ncbi:MAG: FKBP-type peptidyl-prolyl cis-trans isomerase [Prevotella sp.]|nr:FKBP-type peptidyl-prolyl cis-trans isomerase [Prevotella sp.]
MKKLTFAAVLAMAVATLFSCGNSTPKANMKTDIDTVSYAIGMLQSQGLKEYLVRNLGVDTTYMDEFYKGLNVGANAGDDKKKAAYYAGIQIGQQVANQIVKGVNYQLFGEDSTQTISLKNLMAGFISGTSGKNGAMTLEEAQLTAQMKMEMIRKQSLEKQYGENKKAGEDFLVKYAKGEGVQKFDDGVLYKVLKEGNGEIPTDTSTVRVYYEGKTIDGNVFDSSDRTKDPIKLRVKQVVKGFSEALTHMPVGSTWEVVIPQELAYGDRAPKDIKPFSTLIFKIELVGTGK